MPVSTDPTRLRQRLGTTFTNIVDTHICVYENKYASAANAPLMASASHRAERQLYRATLSSRGESQNFSNLSVEATHKEPHPHYVSAGGRIPCPGCLPLDMMITNMTMTRREALKLAAAAGAAALTTHASAQARSSNAAKVPVYGIFELTYPGPQNANPFTDVSLTAEFSLDQHTVKVTGFYDGGGTYKIRFMPDTPGVWRFRTTSNVTELSGASGQFEATPAVSHGPVRVNNVSHFAYKDGTPYFPFGTTSYAWIHQSEGLQRETLASLKNSPFNKVRMCVFPKHYEYNHNEPEFYPFERSGSGVNDFTRPNPKFFQHLEQRISDLQAIGVQADLILFHPYDRWGYQSMAAQQDDFYLRYVLARLSAHANIWWSMANEYDLMKAKTAADFDRLFQIVEKEDPYGHLRSIHYSRVEYDYSHPWVTHASHQAASFNDTPNQIARLKKPILFDEVQYEGNLNRRWGNIDGDELVYRFWRGVIHGAYVTHGETLLPADAEMTEDQSPTLWWAHGGKLHGTSPAGIGFLRQLVEQTITPGNSARAGLEAQPKPYYDNAIAYDATGKPATILYFFDEHRPLWYEFALPEGEYTAEYIDPIAMKITPLPGRHSGKAKLRLGPKMYQALRFRRI